MKKQTTATKAKKGNETKLITEINLQKFAEKLQSVEVKEKKKKQTIYIYPDGWSEQKINSEDGKKFRNHKRNAVQRFCNNILTFAKTNRPDELKKEISLFNSFYKEFYKVNDFSIQSISNSKETGDIALMLEIIKEVQK